MTRKKIMRIVRSMDKKIDVTSEEFWIACILLDAALLGANSKLIAKDLELPLKFVESYETRLRESKTWVGSKTHCEWLDKENGGIAFWCDVLVAQGLIQKAKAK